MTRDRARPEAQIQQAEVYPTYETGLKVECPFCGAWIKVVDTSGETVECTEFENLPDGCGRTLEIEVTAQVKEVEGDDE